MYVRVYFCNAVYVPGYLRANGVSYFGASACVCTSQCFGFVVACKFRSICLSVGLCFSFYVCLCVCLCSTSPSGGNQVDGLPPASSCRLLAKMLFERKRLQDERN